MSLIAKIPDILKEAQEEYEKCRQQAFRAVYQYGDDDSGNIVSEGDNLEFMKFLIETMDMKGRINLIYVDPPFFTKLRYEAVVKMPATDENISIPAYTDKWEEGEAEYLRMLCSRLIAMKELLTKDGCLWVHLDWHISHYTKILLDELFGHNNFVNEIVWTYKSGGSSKRHFSRKHDTLLFYSKTKQYYFKPQKEKSYNRGFKPYHFKGVEEFCDDTGWYTLVNMKDVWNIDMVGRTSAERTGYATQKPEALMMRILESCSREGDICADFFAGSGTLAAAAHKMNRHFITCDGGTLATSMCTKRLAANMASFTVMSENDDISEPPDTIDIKYSSQTGEFTVDAGEYINSLEEGSEAVVMWSIDWNYDGSVHKAADVQLRSKAGIAGQLSGAAGEEISVAFTGITGTRKQYVILTKKYE